MLGPRADAAGTVWSRRRLVAKLDGDAAVSARVGSDAGPGGCGRAGAGRVRAWPGRRDRAGAEPDAVVVDEEVSSNKIGL